MKDYGERITSEHRDKPRFMATVRAFCEPLAALQDDARAMLAAFDVEAAIGDQLDIIGQWAGIGRGVTIPINTYYFAWYDAQNGWDVGIWQEIGAITTGTYDLPDDMYKALIKAKIMANKWRGTIPEIYDILHAAFPSHVGDFRVVDGTPEASGATFAWDMEPQNGWGAGWWSASEDASGAQMYFWILLREGAFIPIEQAIIESGALPIKPAGVRCIYSTFSGA